MLADKEWSRLLVTDQELEEAYGKVGDLKRSWIKKHLAYLFSFYGHEVSLEKTRTYRQRTGFVYNEAIIPVPAAVMVADSCPGTWNRVLAALVPAIAAGVDNISAFLLRSKQGVCPEMFTALELAGIEDIFIIEHAQAGAVMEMSMNINAVILDLCSQTFVPADFSQRSAIFKTYIRLYFAGKPRGLIWAGEQEDWDYETVRWANPDMEFTVSGPKAESAPRDFRRSALQDSEILEGKWDIFLGPEHMFNSAGITRGFSRGLEPFWLWPEIDKALFMTNRVYWKENG
jgi:hypothetical protein